MIQGDSRLDHERACSGFTSVVDQVGDRWHRQSPCDEWDARAVVEHVIGFHEVLVLRPSGITAHRPKDDIPRRWTTTQHAISLALERDESWSALDLGRLLPMLTTDVLVHTWDLAKAVGSEPNLDEELVQRSLVSVSRSRAALADSGMYSPPVEVAVDAPSLDRLLGLVGRDPSWPR